jgi:glucosyl-dolichyl phosphate glucuronosyltransferase
VSVTVAIPTLNDDPDVFCRVLDLVASGAPGVPVVVVDMSTEDGVRRVCAGRDGVRYHAFPESGGVSHSRNRGVQIAQTRYVAFLDSDAFPEAGWLDPLVARLEDCRVAVVGSRILPAWESRPPRLLNTVPAWDWLSLLDLGDWPVDVPRIIGTSYALDRERVPEPPFDESTGRKPGWPLAMEENVLCDAARADGWRVVYEPASVVRHRIPPERASWRWMWRRAHTAGRETRAAGRFEPLPRPRLTPRDRLFQAVVAPAFFAGLSARRRSRGAAA